MFDVSFLELAVIAVIALIVLGPERLPTAARAAGLWIGRIRRTIGNVQREISSQLETEELQRQMKQKRDRVDQGLSKVRREVEGLGDNSRQSDPSTPRDEKDEAASDASSQHASPEDTGPISSATDDNRATAAPDADRNDTPR
ncbi:Sec-independent protein translocase protein TatB [Kushneria phosphatilytica]|uniref:Sec-independent protein translocase protein TatB n=1 Tax=Kushneria phosphatilytica TaxID=657387 RepID=A0A1S1NYN1_9GAMM|nr:Sec-independent protein translocase protein TatB [Kushneria phosphatilytica]OHV10495.1 twin arginine-targeting protein translocase TatB [Kushneria phosphatilytica]QEL11951.1 twin-arginine translocase subunit TatB [Kushneria phosphatilytica]